MAISTNYQNNDQYLAQIQQQQARTQAQTQAAQQDDKAAESAGAAGQTAPAYQVNLQTQESTDNAQGVAATQKGLSADQIRALRDDMAKQQQDFLAMMTQKNITNQAGLAANAKGEAGALNGIETGAEERNGLSFDLPAVGNTPEEAQAAISEGGQYSVDAVAERVVSMAQNIANGDSKKLEEMRSAITKGFEQAGKQFNKIYGNQNMPQITQDTQNEIMKRLDNVQKSYQQQNDQQASKVNAAASTEM